MRQDLLVTLQRSARALAPPLRPLRPVLSPLHRLGRRAFDRLLALRYPPGELMVAEQNGRRWKLDPEVALRGPLQEYDTVLWFREVVRPGMQVIDVGANVGQMTLELAELVGSDGRVLAIEPAVGNLQLLRRHVEGNGMSERVEIIDAACAAAHGGTTAFFVRGDSAEAVGSGHTTWTATQPDLATHEVRVSRVSIDGLCEERGFEPALLKIDVEGGELEVLHGATRTLRSARPALLVGFHPFAFADVLAASKRLREVLHEHSYSLIGPASGPLDLAEYVAKPIEL